MYTITGANRLRCHPFSFSFLPPPPPFPLLCLPSLKFKCGENAIKMPREELIPFFSPFLPSPPSTPISQKPQQKTSSATSNPSQTSRAGTTPFFPSFSFPPPPPLPVNGIYTGTTMPKLKGSTQPVRKLRMRTGLSPPLSPSPPSSTHKNN